MAWIELHDDLPDHDKVLRLADMLKLDKDMVVGKLVRLWLWALNNRESGVLSPFDILTIAEKMRYKGSAKCLTASLVECGLLDQDDGGYRIHNWDKRVCMLMDKREEIRRQNAMRKERERRRKRTAQSELYTAWMDNFGRPANPAQIEELEMIAAKYDHQVAEELIRTAAVADADQPVPYIKGICRYLDLFGIHSYEDYAKYSDEIDAAKCRDATKAATKINV